MSIRSGLHPVALVALQGVVSDMLQNLYMKYLLIGNYIAVLTQDHSAEIHKQGNKTFIPFRTMVVLDSTTRSP